MPKKAKKAKKRVPTGEVITDLIDAAVDTQEDLKNIEENLKKIAKRALDLTLKNLNKKILGNESKELRIGRFGDLKAIDIEATPTGSLALDCAIGVGGVPRGRTVEIYGPESSGKTTLCLHIIAEAQKSGGNAAFIDVEHALDPDYAGNLGVDMSQLVFSQPDNGDEAMEIVDALVDSGQFDVIAIDSVSALVPRAEMAGEITDNHIGRQARLMSQSMRRLVSKCNKTHTTLIFVNQIRMKIGVMFGNPETTSGGNALKFYSSVRLDIRRGEAIKDGDEVIGAIAKVRVVKNKVAPPFKRAQFKIMFGTGIDQEDDVITMASELGIIEQKGAWYSYNGDNIGQGLANASLYLKENPDTIRELREKVLAALYPKETTEE